MVFPPQVLASGHRYRVGALNPSREDGTRSSIGNAEFLGIPDKFQKPTYHNVIFQAVR
jgi:hypothetical protein